MKKIILFLLLINLKTGFSQSVPPVINYQAVARDANGEPVNGNVSVRLYLSTSANPGGSIYQETYSNIPTFKGLFNIKFGSTGGGIPANLNWGSQPYYLVIELDPAGGANFSPLGSQQLLSVPMALYAEKAGNSTSYTAGTNISINNNTISSTPSLSISGNTLSISGGGTPVVLPGGSGQGTLTASPNATVTSVGTNSFNIDIPNYIAGNNITITPAGGNNYSISATGGGTPVPGSFSVNGPHTQTTVLNSTTLNIVSPNMSITGGGGSVTNNVLPNYILNIPSVAITPTPGGLSVVQGPISYTVGLAGGPWMTTGNNVFLVTGTNNVGIGTGAPVSKLEVQAQAGGTLAAITAVSQNSTGVFALTNSTGTLDAAVRAVNNAAGSGVIGTSASSSTFATGVKGLNLNAGTGVQGENMSNSALFNAMGVRGITNSSHVYCSGVLGENFSAGPGVYGWQGGGGGVNSVGVLGISNSNTAPGILGYNFGGQPGVMGTSNNGNAGGNAHGIRGESNGTSTLAAGVSGFNSGPGPAVKASLPLAIIAGGLNAALLIENGHIKAVGATATAGTYTFSGFTAGAIGFGPSISGNDVRGTVNFYTPNGFTGVLAGAYVEQEVVFAKPYSSIPTIVITPQTDLIGFDFRVTSMSSGGFRIRVYRTSNTNITGPTSVNQNYQMFFSYIIIE